MRGCGRAGDRGKDEDTDPRACDTLLGRRGYLGDDRDSQEVVGHCLEAREKKECYKVDMALQADCWYGIVDIVSQQSSCHNTVAPSS